MKKRLLFILFPLSLAVKAQVTEILVPNDYYITTGTNLAYGASVPFYQNGNYLYTIASDVNGSSGSGKIFKINQATNQITEIQAAVPVSFISVGGIPFYIGAYQDKSFFTNVQGWCSQLDTATNTFTAEYFPVSNQAGYQGLAVYGNQILNGTGLRKNIDNGLESFAPTYIDENGEELGYASPTFKVFDNLLLSLWYGFSPSAGIFGSFKILQDNGIGFSSFYTSPNETINPLAGNKQNFIKLNDRLIFFKQTTQFPYQTQLMSNPLVNGENYILESGEQPFVDLFIYNNELYYYQSVSNTIKKTDGYTVTDVTGLNGLPESYLNFSFTSNDQPYNSFIEFNNEMYFNKNVGTQTFLVRYNGTQETIISEIAVQHARVHNNKLYFSGYNAHGWGLFCFDGMQLKKLYLGDIQAQTWGGTSLFGYDHYLFFGNGTALVKVDLDTVLSTADLDSEVKTSKPLVCPNPAKDFVVLSETVSSVLLFDAAGKQLPLKWTSKQIDVSSLAKGIYFLKVTNQYNQVNHQKLIKE